MIEKSKYKANISFIKSFPVYFILIGLLWILYVGLTLFAPYSITVNRHGLSLLQTNLLTSTFIIPYLFIWLAGLFAVLKLHFYTKLINNSPEHGGFKKLVWGMHSLVAVVIIPPFIELVAIYFPESPDILKIVTIVRNNVTVILYLISFFFFWRGSQTLLQKFALSNLKHSYLKYILGALFILASSYIWLVLDNPFRTSSNDPLVRPTYYLSDIKIFLTVIIPYLLVWLLGLFTIANFRVLIREIPGIIYHKAFRSFSNGLIIIISLVISLQFLTQATIFFRFVGLGFLLLIIYIIIFSIAASYIYLARGASELSEIEKI
ncbi:MAG: hypothetical protein M3Q24_00360 [bacterium]|nr:hypothetical protein [bacterium]